jgi:hypothetical protein
MRFMFAMAALVAASLLTAPRAEAAGWCYDGEQGDTCGFVTLQQCLDALWGNAVGTCVQNLQTSTYEIVRTPARRKTKS